MQSTDTNLDGVINPRETNQYHAAKYADQLMTQLKKGSLSYCVLLACRTSSYTSEIIQTLMSAELEVVEGTIYPLLARLQKDGLLTHKWRESTQGPPRKYYEITPYGQIVRTELGKKIKLLNKVINNLERNPS